MMIVEKSEDLINRKICVSIRADVEPVVIKEQITSKINAFVRKQRNVPTGLPEGKWIRIIKTKNLENEVLVVAECKESFTYHLATVRIIYFDKDGVPDESNYERKRCPNKGDILRFNLPLPNDPSMTYSIDIPE